MANRHHVFLLFALCLVALGLRLNTAQERVLRLDEACMALDSRPSLGSIASHVWSDPRHTKPPLGYMVTHLSLVAAGDTPLGVRLPSILFGTGCVVLIYLTALLLLGPQAALLAAAMAALSPFGVYHSQEGRMYTQLTFFGLAAFYALLRCLSKGRGFVPYGGCIALCFYTHYLCFLVLAPHGLILVLLAAGIWSPTVGEDSPFSSGHLKGRARKALVAFFLGVLVYSPWTIPFFKALSRDLAQPRNIYPLRAASDLTFSRLGQHVHIVYAYLFGNTFPQGELLALRFGLSETLTRLFLCLPFLAVLATPLGWRRFSRQVIIAALLVPLLCALAGSATFLAFSTHYDIKYYFPYSPYFFLLLAAGLVTVRPRLRWVLAAAWLLLAGVSLSTYFWDPLYHPVDFGKVATVLQKATTPRDRILLHYWEIERPLSYYWGPSPPAAPIIGPKPGTDYEALAERMFQEMTTGQRLFLVLNRQSYSDAEGLLERAIAKRFTPLGVQRDFRKLDLPLTLYILRRRD